MYPPLAIMASPDNNIHMLFRETIHIGISYRWLISLCSWAAAWLIIILANSLEDNIHTVSHITNSLLSHSMVERR